MANLSQTFRGTATIEYPSTPTIYNVTTGLAGAETSQALNTGTKQLLIRARSTADLQISFTAAATGTNFITIPKRTSYTITDINYSGSIYFQAPNDNNVVVEILEWST